MQSGGKFLQSSSESLWWPMLSSLWTVGDSSQKPDSTWSSMHGLQAAQWTSGCPLPVAQLVWASCRCLHRLLFLLGNLVDDSSFQTAWLVWSLLTLGCLVWGSPLQPGLSRRDAQLSLNWGWVQWIWSVSGTEWYYFELYYFLSLPLGYNLSIWETRTTEYTFRSRVGDREQTRIKDIRDDFHTLGLSK